MQRGVTKADDGVSRCPWGVAPAEYRAYHDREWGRPVTDEVRIFEKLCLEGFQSGLSWLTILRKREAFRRAFAGFDIPTVARFGRRDVERLLADAGIVRNRGKIEAAIGNARAVRELQADGDSLAGLVWRYEPASGPAPRTLDDIVASSPESSALSKELRRRGLRFVGPTTVYASMQSLGLVNDHLRGCHARRPIEEARRALVRPRSVRRTPSDRASRDTR
ncbi:MAG TPA: DNA-3-methyladenine glycosylase I [Acidimicrobiales bacterium]|nr:DNA-3-methyladenine glycosylase I [Acidimicrobiales bacterium]